MKKIVSIILSAALLMSMSVTAFAADNEQTITVTIPEREFTMTMPAKTDIKYGSNDVVAMGDYLKITSTNPTLLFSNNHYVEVEVTYGNLVHSENQNYTLPLSVFWAKPTDESDIQGGYDKSYTWENLASKGSVTFSGQDFYWTNGYRLGAKVTGWENAEPGEYQATVTYTATIKQK